MEKTFEKLYYRYVKQDSTTDPQSPSEKGSLKHSTVSELSEPRWLWSSIPASELSAFTKLIVYRPNSLWNFA